MGLDTLDVAIGLVFVYLMVSFVCSAGVELVEVFLKNRPKKLLEGIHELMGQSGNLVKKIYDDPLVNALYRGKFGDVKPTELPSYIPARNFALAVLNQVPGVSATADWDQINTAVSGYFTDADRAKLTELRSATASGDVTQKAQILELEAKEQITKVLKSALLTAEKDIDKALKNVEDWYNSSMDRVSGWFKRRTQYILLGFGAVCAVIYNIDTIDIISRLAKDKAVRAAVVASAGAAVSENQAVTTTGAPAQKPKEEVKKPPTVSGGAAGAPTTSTTGTSATDTASTAAKPAAPAGNAETNKSEVQAAKDRLTNALDKLQDTGLPIGWGAHPEFHWAWVPANVWKHGLGWLLTAIAVSFGAPFWFDVLNKFMVVRSTVKPKEKSEPEKSKD